MRAAEIDATFFYETENAVLLSVTGERADAQWVPKSQILNFPDYAYEPGEGIEVTVSQWFAEKEGLV